MSICISVYLPKKYASRKHIVQENSTKKIQKATLSFGEWQVDLSFEYLSRLVSASAPKKKKESSKSFSLADIRIRIWISSGGIHPSDF